MSSPLLLFGGGLEIGWVEIRQKHVTDLVGVVLGLSHEAQLSALSARAKQMLRGHFPKASVAHGRVATYSVEEALMLMVAFLLLETGMTTVHAMELVSAHWPRFHSGLVSSAVDADRIFTVVPGALTMVGLRKAADKRRIERGMIKPERGVAEGENVASLVTISIDLRVLAGRLESVEGTLGEGGAKLRELSAALVLYIRTGRTRAEP